MADLLAPSQIGSSFLKNKSFGADQEPYDIEPTNWYKSLPYGFSFYNIDASDADSPTTRLYLPISPNNLTVVTHYATNIITTLYGIVEEHSEIRYYDITIQGTTGFAPRFVEPFGADKNEHSNGRSSFSNGGITDLGGFLPEVTNMIGQALDTASDVMNIVNGGPKNPTGITPNQSGYVAFHNLYRFFAKYKADASQMNKTSTPLPFGISIPTVDTDRKSHPIQFLNYKDNIKYDCVPIKFTMVRSAEDPMLYNYNIQLRAFNLRNVNEKAQESSQLEKLGLGGLEGQSLFGKMTSLATNAATYISEKF